jgi:hypothetical protein
MWVQAKPHLARSSTVYPLDEKYASQNDYQCLLTALRSLAGDGWSGLHGVLHRGPKSTAREGI